MTGILFQRRRQMRPVSQWDPRSSVSEPIYSDFNFSPLSLSPALWLDASDTTTITESGGSVSQWNDKSGNGYNFTQGTGANQPTTGIRTVNGLNAVDFDGGDAMTAGDVLDLGTNSLSIFAVAQSDVFTVAGKTIIGKYKVTPAAGSYLMLNENFAQRVIYVHSTSTNVSIAYSSTAAPFMQSGVIDREAGVVSTWLNQVGFNSASFTPDSGTSRNISTSLWLGALRNSTDTGFQGGYFWDGAICEIIFVLRPLTFNEVRMTENYLRAKWATP